jgi:hypothetical protein
MSVPVYFYVSEPRGVVSQLMVARKHRGHPPTEGPPPTRAKIAPRRPLENSLQRLIDLAA